MKFLVPVDGSECSQRAVDHLIQLARCRPAPEIHLLNVREPVDAWEVRRFLNDDEIASVQESEGEADLRAARAKLDAAGLAYEVSVRTGPVAQTIADFADEKSCDHIVMGTHGRSGLANVLLGSVVTQVIHLTRLPVLLVR